MDPEQLAQLYGYGPATTPSDSGNYDQPPETAAPTPVGAEEPADIWEKLAAAAGHGLGVVTSLPPAAPPGVAQSVGESYSGVNEGKFKRFQGKKGYEARVADERQKQMDRAGQLAGQYENAANEQTDALAKQAKLETGYGEVKRTGQMDLAALNDRYAQEEQAAVERARAESEAAKADYAASLADFRAQRIRPGQLFDNMTSGQRFGTLISAAITDYLGVQGVKSSALDILNKAVDRNIDAQIQNIRLKGEATEGFKNLWEMARAQSATDAEARTRVRGYALQSVSDELEGNLARYEGGLAAAKTQALMAQVHKELVGTVQQVYQHADENAYKSQSLELEKRGQDIRAATEAANRRESARQFDLTHPPPGPQNVADSPYLLYDVNSPDASNPIRKFRLNAKGEPVLSDVEMKDTRAHIDAGTYAVKAVRDLIQWRRDHPPPVDPMNLAGWKTQAERMYDAMLTSVQNQRVYDQSGKQINQNEFERIKKEIPFESLFTRGSNAPVLELYIKHRVTELNNELDQNTDPLEPYAPGKRPRSAYMQAELDEANAVIEGRDGQKQDYVDRLVGNIDDKAGDEAATEIPKDAKEDWQQFTGGGTGEDVGTGFGGARKQPVWAVNMSRLRDEIKDFTDKPAPDTEDDTYSAGRGKAKYALDQLIRWATPNPMSSGDQELKDKEAYAQLMLHSLDIEIPALDGETPGPKTATSSVEYGVP